jgi:xanthine phosphoribosyltransferase
MSVRPAESEDGIMQMKLLQDRIVADGKIEAGNILKVDSFLNHQIDVSLLEEIGQEFKRQFGDREVNKILTIEASGIAIACIAARYFNVPVVFAKKSRSLNIAGDVYTAKVESFTHKNTNDIIVSKKFLSPEDRILIVDDFLANGKAILGLCQLVEQAGATLVGAGVVIEKGFQDGGKRIREAGIDLRSLAILEEMDVNTGIRFREE